MELQKTAGSIASRPLDLAQTNPQKIVAKKRSKKFLEKEKKYLATLMESRNMREEREDCQMAQYSRRKQEIFHPYRDARARRDQSLLVPKGSQDAQFLPITDEGSPSNTPILKQQPLPLELRERIFSFSPVKIGDIEEMDEDPSFEGNSLDNEQQSPLPLFIDPEGAVQFHQPNRKRCMGMISTVEDEEDFSERWYQNFVKEN